MQIQRVIRRAALGAGLAGVALTTAACGIGTEPERADVPAPQPQQEQPAATVAEQPAPAPPTAPPSDVAPSKYEDIEDEVKEEWFNRLTDLESIGLPADAFRRDNGKAVLALTLGVANEDDWASLNCGYVENERPIWSALTAADNTAADDRRLVLVTTGGERCRGDEKDPDLPQATEAAADSVSPIDVIALDPPYGQQNELREIARQGRGTFQIARDPQELYRMVAQAGLATADRDAPTTP